MRAATLDRLITIQRVTVTASPSGEPTTIWAATVHKRRASYRPLRGDERFTIGQEVASEEVEFAIRYSDDVADISPLDRIIYPSPADSDVQAPAHTTIYDILAAPEIGRREGVRIVAVRRADVTS